MHGQKRTSDRIEVEEILSKEDVDPGLVTLAWARTEAQAYLIFGLLKGAGIPAYVSGALLQDEWAMFQKLTGQLSVEVKVPASHLEDARALLEEARQNALDDNTIPGAGPEPGAEVEPEDVPTEEGAL